MSLSTVRLWFLIIAVFDVSALLASSTPAEAKVDPNTAFPSFERLLSSGSNYELALIKYAAMDGTSTDYFGYGDELDRQTTGIDSTIFEGRHYDRDNDGKKFPRLLPMLTGAAVTYYYIQEARNRGDRGASASRTNSIEEVPELSTLAGVGSIISPGFLILIRRVRAPKVTV